MSVCVLDCTFLKFLNHSLYSSLPPSLYLSRNLFFVLHCNEKLVRTKYVTPIDWQKSNSKSYQEHASYLKSRFGETS